MKRSPFITTALALAIAGCGGGGEGNGSVNAANIAAEGNADINAAIGGDELSPIPEAEDDMAANGAGAPNAAAAQPPREPRPR